MKKKRGQSTIEFALVMIVFIFFLSLSYNAVVSFSIHQYLSYATFMTARSYQAARGTPAEQLAAAKRTMSIYVPGVNDYSGGEKVFRFGSRPLAWIRSFSGPTTGQASQPFKLVFDVPFVTFPLAESMRTSFGRLQLSAESNLGREPTRQECQSFFDDFFSSFAGGGIHRADGMDDNGC